MRTISQQLGEKSLSAGRKPVALTLYLGSLAEMPDEATVEVNCAKLFLRLSSSIAFLNHAVIE